MKILFIGDIVGKPGRRALKEGLPSLIDRHKIDFVIANAENAAGGFGVTKPVVEEILSIGVNILTSGNHIWDKKESVPLMLKEKRLLRPANYPDNVPGKGDIIAESPSGIKVGVLNLSGRVFMHNLNCPFITAEKFLASMKLEAKVIVVDFHAEATSEKCALGWFLDGEVTAVIGTHTHVQTADEKILPGGTAYITDAGMTGPSNSIIGVKKELIIDKFLTQMPVRFETAGGDTVLSGVLIDVSPDSGRAIGIERLQITLS